MKALVLGGTGVIGGVVVRELIGRGYGVLALARSEPSMAGPEPGRTRYVRIYFIDLANAY